jgi:leucyl-tRNA synthetase
METMYKPQEIEAAAQQFWQEKNCFRVTEDLGKPKFYCLSMFPYPSGALHMGHVRNYTLGDVISRYQLMNGKNVLQPIGWDAFGLPAENAAKKHNVPPAQWTYENIAAMRTQLQRLGFAYDWSREIATCDPSYYRWEQWFFLQLYAKKLVYRKNALVNWDPVDETVLANEQVIDGKGWRSGAIVEQREIPQWFIKITTYADELLDGLDKLDGWPEQVRTMQRNWIGRSSGIEINFQIPTLDTPLKVFTTRVDTLFGCSYLAIAPDHPLAKKCAATDKALADFLTTCQRRSGTEAELATQEKLGHRLAHTATHPLTKTELPIFVANFVLLEYGTGAVMAVPAHDQRDWEFAHKYQLPVHPVIEPVTGENWDYLYSAFTQPGVLKNSAQFSKLSTVEASHAIATHLTEQNIGTAKTSYRLRDWGISRQRYWGTPIPIIHCQHCGAVPVPESDLPVVLPEQVAISNSQHTLKSVASFYDTTCPSCGEAAHRETDTFDTFIESSWYYARFACVNQAKTMLDDRATYWTPVDHYIGGVEHAVMHLLYARFFHKLMRDEDLLNSDEPCKKLLTQGMVLKDGAKMSKSKGNTVDPQAYIDRYGADTVRCFILFAAPPEQSLEWSDTGVEGAYRFIRKLHNFVMECEDVMRLNQQSEQSRAGPDWSMAPLELLEQRRQLHEILQQINYDYERSQFNTIVSGAMKLLRCLADIKALEAPQTEHLLHEGVLILLKVLAPITPHVCHYLWQTLHYGDALHNSPWPKVSKEALQVEEACYVVQINGKLRAQIILPLSADDEIIEQKVIADPKIQMYLQHKLVHKCIIIKPRRLVNLVVREG